MKNNNKIQMLRSVFTEIISIVIGVLLALAVNEWNENRIRTARADEAIQNIINEIDSNIKFMGIVNINNKAVIESLNNESGEPSDINKDESFVPGLQIQDTAWQTLQSTGVAEHIKYPTLYTLSKVYSLQDIYKNLSYQFIQNVANHRILLSVKEQSVTSSIDSKVFITDMQLIENVEGVLLDSYKKTLAQLKINRKKKT